MIEFGLLLQSRGDPGAVEYFRKAAMNKNVCLGWVAKSAPMSQCKIKITNQHGVPTQPARKGFALLADVFEQGHWTWWEPQPHVGFHLYIIDFIVYWVEWSRWARNSKESRRSSQTSQLWCPNPCEQLLDAWNRTGNTKKFSIKLIRLVEHYAGAAMEASLGCTRICSDCWHLWCVWRTLNGFFRIFRARLV